VTQLQSGITTITLLNTASTEVDLQGNCDGHVCIHIKLYIHVHISAVSTGHRQFQGLHLGPRTKQNAEDIGFASEEACEKGYEVAYQRASISKSLMCCCRCISDILNGRSREMSVQVISTLVRLEWEGRSGQRCLDGVWEQWPCLPAVVQQPGSEHTFRERQDTRDDLG
jgi:hypothetical protein